MPDPLVPAPIADTVPRRAPRLLLVFGLLAAALAVLSVVDIALPRPWDGIVLEADAPGRLTVRRVAPGSGAARAGVQPGDVIRGIDRYILHSATHAAELLSRHDRGATVPYFVQRDGQLLELAVTLGQRWIASPAYIYGCLLGFLFFGIGLFVLMQQPRQRTAQVFFLLATLFMLFLVCRLRPASYSWVDSFVLTTGTIALMLLPAAFLHFFLIFPRPVPLRPHPDAPGYRSRRLAWLALLALIYLVPEAVFGITLLRHLHQEAPLYLISGAPQANWWVLAIYMVLGLAVLAVNGRRVRDRRGRRAALLIFMGSVLGVLPFLVLGVAFPAFLQTESFVFLGIAPLIFVPLTFAYAIVRFQLLDVRVILRRSLLYTATSAVVTGLYALGIAFTNSLTRGTALETAPYFPVLFALAIVLLFEPLRHWMQQLLNRFFRAERRRLQETLEALGGAFTAQVDLEAVVRDLVERLPDVLGLHYAVLYLTRDGGLERVAGVGALPATLPPNDVPLTRFGRLPSTLPLLPDLRRELAARDGLAPTAVIPRASAELEALLLELEAAGARYLADLASARRHLGLLVLSGSVSGMALEREELRLLAGILGQASIALEASILLEERTRQAELEQEMRLASTLQASLLPERLEPGRGWRVAALCRPAREVGGDFLTELPGPGTDGAAIAYGDVAGKSVSGALVMMAAHEMLHSLALADPDPIRLLDRANQRLYQLGRRRSFVALGYLAPAGEQLFYTLAGQPQPLVRRINGCVEELSLPRHRLPLGALLRGEYELMRTRFQPGDLLIAYSDGALEAQSPDGELFGNERLMRAVESAPTEPKEAIDHVMRAIDRFIDQGSPYDDITLIALTYEAAP
ncbi:MAG: SpoIIE family protein phosphatase [Thermoanaerobaculia bacterium]